MSFKVVARPQVTITLEPGMNLVSFPEVPAEPGINEVFGADSGVDVVLSYDPSLDVPWLISQRNAEGVFGEDAEIQSVQVGRAYWVQTEGFSDIKYASRPYLDPTQVPPPPPPVIPVLGGESNLIGFISLTGDRGGRRRLLQRREVAGGLHLRLVRWMVGAKARRRTADGTSMVEGEEGLHRLRIRGRLGDAVTSPPAKH